ncbi:TonB-dependent receptor [Chryseobacterium gotjawalense]|uniref:TonB-dependent receptor n=1 Tax=Chryseobacterium gotjawalense TaxID=3042315 RepID=A0ABY8RC92_9FLAO|nr:TonB-dependent receptor [Chryseobacterium sp. wdc7]WHF50793.1 TonB-dependent receptor [Chryseobacterium sp. wdc7]
MKKISTLFILFISVLTWAQSSISGKILDTDGQPIPSASVTVEEPGKDAIIAYSITNSKGEFKVTFTSAEQNVDVKVKAFNQKPLQKVVKNENQTQNFTLQDDATEIKEVKLKAKMITKRGDTISYDIKAFESKSDRTLSDVLKKIPGIDVNKDGTVLYQGEPINKFYVNGKDLMEGGYGTINNSLPTGAVSKVEVMENHQPVKILQDKVPSESAAINIKLKKSVTMTGRGEVGAGLDPLLWNVKLTPMFFGQKNQWVVNYKANNNGESVEKEGNILSFGNRYEGRRGNVSQSKWLNVENASSPNLPEKRYLMNNVHYFSANLLTNPFDNKEWELKANASYTNNAVSRESYSETNNFLSNTKYSTNILNHFYTDKAKGEVIFTKNAKKGFFKNVTTFSQFWNADRANVNQNDIYGIRNGQESLESPTSSFQNSLSTIIPWKEKLVNLMSYINYQNDRQALEINPSSYLKFKDLKNPGHFLFENTDTVIQDLKIKTLDINHSASVGFSAKKWTFTPEIGFNFSTNQLDTELSTVTNGIRSPYGNDYRNDLKFTEAIPYATLGINYRSDAWMLYSQFPFNFNSIKAQDPDRNVSKSINKLTFEPTLFAQYTFASFWKASANANLNYNFGNTSDNYAGFIFSSPTSPSAMSANNPIPETIAKSVGSKLEYRNPLNNLFFNVNYRYSKTNRNIIGNSINDGSGFVLTSFRELDNQSNSNSMGAEIGKYLPKFKTNTSFSFNNTLSKTDALTTDQNDVPYFFVNKSNSQSLGFKFNNTYFSWMSVDYNLSFSWNHQQNQFNDSKNSGFNHNLSTYFYPVENHTIGFNWDQINSGNNLTSYHNGFYDVSYQYTWAKKKIDFELKWLNIGNRKVFERFSTSTISDSYTRMQLRPRQIMFTVKFNFK